MTKLEPPGDIPDDWFSVPHVPHLINNEIGEKVQNQMVAKSSYVLSRIIGRKDLSNHLKITDIPLRKEHDLIKETDPEKRKAQTRLMHADKCWVESEECWVCQRWNYILPLVTRNEIEECCAGEE